MYRYIRVWANCHIESHETFGKIASGASTITYRQQINYIYQTSFLFQQQLHKQTNCMYLTNFCLHPLSIAIKPSNVVCFAKTIVTNYN